METRRQILDYITQHIREHGASPAVREIAAACGISSISVVAFHLRRLELDGLIERDRRVARGIRLRGARFVVPGDPVQVDIDGLVTHGAFVA